jgi:hypothetical protein
MIWDNYGLYNGTEYGWDIDHIIPSSSAITEEELLKLITSVISNHYVLILIEISKRFFFNHFS